MADVHRCGPWLAVDTRAGEGASHLPGPDTIWVCQVCRRPMYMDEGRTPCPGCGELLPFDEVLAHDRCGYTAGSPDRNKT